jgi:hypothetical protein
MGYIKFRHHNGKHDMVNFNGLQLCIDQGVVREFYRPSEKQWVNPIIGPIRKKSDQSIQNAGGDRRNINYNSDSKIYAVTKR